MLVKIFNHFRLTWRLARDKRVSAWLKLFLYAIPLAYAVIPFPIEVPDFFPVLGLIDDFLFLAVTSLVFVALCPRPVVYEHESALGIRKAGGGSQYEAYRHPEETRHLAWGFGLIVVSLIAAGALAGFVMLLLYALSYQFTRWERQRILASAVRVSERQLPHIHQVFREVAEQFPRVNVNLLVSQNPLMNAYTFGQDEPYTIVLTSELVKSFSPEELRTVIAHEFGHILLGHTQILSLMTTSVTGLERLFFYRWSRSCEYSCDAIALLTSNGELTPVISALLKLSSGLTDQPVDLEAFLEQDGDPSSTMAEMMSTHPFIANRIRRLIQLASSHGFLPPDPRVTLSTSPGARMLKT